MLKGTIANTLGAGFLGLVAASILFGVTIVQSWIYYCNFPNDWRFQKISVALLMALDAFHLGITTHAMYYYMISQFGKVQGLQSVVWTFKLQTTLNVIIVFIVQSLYTLRVWKLGKHKSGGALTRIIPWIITVIVIAGGVIGLVLCVKTFQLPHFDSIRDISWSVQSSFAMTTVIDVVLAGAICYYLQQSRTAFTATSNRIVVVMHYVLISGALTAACSLSALITFATMKNNLIFLGISFLLTKLYVNSYIAMLNARRSGQDHESSSFNVARLMNLKRRQKENPNTPSDDTPPDQNSSLALSSIGYRARLDGDELDGKHDKADLAASMGGVTIHRIEERKYDDDETKNWNRV